MTDQNTELTPEEQKASKNGWKPQSEWEGDADDWVPAKEFNERGRMIGKLMREERRNNKLAQELKQVKESLKLLSDHNRKIAEETRKQTIEELKGMKKDALKDQDFDAVIEIDEQIANVKELEKEEAKAAAEETTQQPSLETPPEAEEWLEDNQDWYNTKNPILKNAFDATVASILSEDETLKNDPGTVLRMATEAIKEEFPEKFDTTPRRTNREVLDPSGNKGKRGNNKYSVGMMSAEQKEAAKRMIASGADISLEDYAQQLGEIGELGA